MFERIVATLDYYVWQWPSLGGQSVPLIVIALLGTGLFLTLRLRFIQVRRLFHGFGVASGRYDDPDEPGDVSHFQALTTALSATVGIGNIAGVAIAIHWGGPGALFWMWVTALLGMAVKFSEVVLAQHYRVLEKRDEDPNRWEGSVSGGPMYYIERGLGKRWKPLAVFFAFALMITSFLTGNAVQANTVADSIGTAFGFEPWMTGLFTATCVGLVIIGGITRIGAVTGILAPLMALIYVLGALYVIMVHYDQVLPTFALIFREAFNPSAGVAGTGVGAFLLTLMWGVRRGLFSNEAGQGSAPIAHAAAKTDEPVSEGVVALLEPFIDTIVICSMTGLVLITTGVWNDKFPTPLDLASGDVSYLVSSPAGDVAAGDRPTEIAIQNGLPVGAPSVSRFAWHDVAVDTFFVDPAQTQVFSGMIYPAGNYALDEDGNRYGTLYGNAVETAAPLTMKGFERGIFGTWGGNIVLMSVFLFAISTAISWSYYGDRCANYLFGPRAVLPYKLVYVAMHFLGAVLALPTVWALGDIALGFVTFPNLIALVLLSGVIVRLTNSYFERQPWKENEEVHKRVVASRKKKTYQER